MKTKILVAAALVLGTSSLALATEFDPNLGNRYPGAGTVVTEGRNAAVSQIQAPASHGAIVDRAGSVSVGF
jgi:hypothetical protein